MMRVRVPATTANLGPGFDRLGLALDRYFAVEATVADTWAIETLGFGEGLLPKNAQNLMARAYHFACQHKGWPSRPLQIRAHNPIPVNAGLGSSATAIVAGLVLAFLQNGASPDRAAIFQMAAQIEGHPDNVAPAVFGGLCDCSKADVSFVCHQRPIDPQISVLIAEVEDSAETEAMRGALPNPIPPELWTRASELVRTLLQGLAQGDTAKLKISEQDPLHQPYRFPLLQRSSKVYEIFKASEALHGAFLSGSGPTVAAWLLGMEHVPTPVNKALDNLAFTVKTSVMQVDTQGFQID